MRLVIIIAVIAALGLLGYVTRTQSKDISNICYGVAGLFFVVFVTVLFVGSPE